MDATTEATNTTLFTHANASDLITGVWRDRKIEVLNPIVVLTQVLTDYQEKTAFLYQKMNIFMTKDVSIHRGTVYVDADKRYTTNKTDLMLFLREAKELSDQHFSFEQCKNLINHHPLLYSKVDKWVGYALNSDVNIMSALSKSFLVQGEQVSEKYFYWFSIFEACLVLSLWGLHFVKMRKLQGEDGMSIGSCGVDAQVYCIFMKHISHLKICHAVSKYFGGYKGSNSILNKQTSQFQRTVLFNFIELVRKQNALLSNEEGSVSIHNLAFEMIEELGISDHVSQVVNDLILFGACRYFTKISAEQETTESFKQNMSELFDMLAGSIILKNREMVARVLSILVYYAQAPDFFPKHEARIEQHFSTIKELVTSMATYGYLNANKKEQRYELLVFLEELSNNMRTLTDKAAEMLEVINKAKSQSKKKKRSEQKKTTCSVKKAGKQKKMKSSANHQNKTKNVSSEDEEIKQPIEKEQIYMINPNILKQGYNPFDSKQINPIIQYVLDKINGCEVSHLEATYEAVKEVDISALTGIDQYATWYALLDQNIRLIEKASQQLATTHYYSNQFASHLANLEPQCNADRNIEQSFMVAYRSLPELIDQFNSCFTLLRNCVGKDILTYAHNAQLSPAEKSDLKSLLYKLTGYINHYAETAIICTKVAQTFKQRGNLIHSLNQGGTIKRSNWVAESGMDDTTILKTIEQLAHEFKTADLSADAELSMRIDEATQLLGDYDD